MKKAVFLDRDGVINRSILIDGVRKPPNKIEDIEILDGVIQAIQILKGLGFVPIVVTNQPDVARGDATKIEVNRINSYIGTATSIESFYTCFHDDIDLCICRKPAPGLIYQAAAELDIDLCKSFLVGDRWRDISAGQSAGCESFFIDYSYNERVPEIPYTKVSSLLEVAEILTGESRGFK